MLLIVAFILSIYSCDKNSLESLTSQNSVVKQDLQNYKNLQDSIDYSSTYKFVYQHISNHLFQVDPYSLVGKVTGKKIKDGLDSLKDGKLNIPQGKHWGWLKDKGALTDKVARFMETFDGQVVGKLTANKDLDNIMNFFDIKIREVKLSGNFSINDKHKIVSF